MSNNKKKFSEKFPEDLFTSKISLQEFIKLKDNKDEFLKEIKTINEGNDVLDNLKEIKKAVQNRVLDLKTEQALAKIARKDFNNKKIKKKNNRKKNNNNEIDDYENLYKHYFKVKKFRDIPNQDHSDNSCERDVDALLICLKDKNLKIHFLSRILDTEGDQTIDASLYFQNELVWQFEKNGDFKASFDRKNCELLIKELKLDQIDKRDFDKIIIDVSMGILILLEENHGDEDEFDLGFGINRETLQETFKKGKNEESSKSGNRVKYEKKKSRCSSEGDSEDDYEFSDEDYDD